MDMQEFQQYASLLAPLTPTTTPPHPHLMMLRMAPGQCCAQASTRVFTMPAMHASQTAAVHSQKAMHSHQLHSTPAAEDAWCPTRMRPQLASYRTARQGSKSARKRVACHH